MPASSEIILKLAPGDAKHPRPESPLVPQAGDLPDHSQQCFLQHILGQIVIKGSAEYERIQSLPDDDGQPAHAPPAAKAGLGK